MNLFLNLDSLKLVRQLASNSEVRSLDFKRGDQTSLRLACSRDGAATLLTGLDELVFVIKAAPGDGPALAVATDWTVDGESYVANLDLNTVPLLAALGSQVLVNLFCELTFTDASGGPNTTQTIRAVLHNDLWRDNEDTPTALPNPEAWYDAAETDLLLATLPNDAFIRMFRPPNAGGRNAFLNASPSVVTEILTLKATAPEMIGVVTAAANVPVRYMYWDGTWLEANDNPFGVFALSSTSYPTSYTDRRPKYAAAWPTSSAFGELDLAGQEIVAVRLGVAGSVNLSNNLLESFIGNASLTVIQLTGNPLREVDLAGMSSSASFDVVFLDDCNLSADAINRAFESLGNTITGAGIAVGGNPGSGACDPSIATAKGWTVSTV